MTGRKRLRKKAGGQKIEKRQGSGPKRRPREKAAAVFQSVKGGGYRCRFCGRVIPQGETDHHRVNCEAFRGREKISLAEART